MSSLILGHFTSSRRRYYLQSFPYCLSQLPVILLAHTLWLSPLPPLWAFPLSPISEFHSSFIFPTRDFNSPQNLNESVVTSHGPLLEDLDTVLLSFHSASTLHPGFSTCPLGTSECPPSMTGLILFFPLSLRFPQCAAPGFSLVSCSFPSTLEPSL